MLLHPYSYIKITFLDKLKKYNNDVENFMETLENRFINLRMDLESKNEKLSKQINLMNRSFKNNGKWIISNKLRRYVIMLLFC